MASEKNIKNRNRIYLIVFLLCNVLMFSLFSNVFCFTFNDLNKLYLKLIDPKSIIVVIVYAISIILEGLISSNIKAIIVFWKIKNPLPGARAFSEIAIKDHRVDIRTLKSLFKSNLPTKPDEQNREWYKLYRKYSSSSIIFESHRAFLLTRDITALTLILIPITILGHLIYHTVFYKILINATILIVIFFISCISSRNYGNRFVANVLVEASQKQKEG